jgi:hypothetical protein
LGGFVLPSGCERPGVGTTGERMVLICTEVQFREPVYGERMVRRAETVTTEIAVETRMALETRST